MSQQLLDTEEIAIPDISQLEIEDDKPVDNFQSEKQQRLLVEPLYSNRVLATPFIAAANVGIFYSRKQEPVVPDAFVSLNVQMPADWSQKQNRSYFVWEFGKAPEVAIEIVSNRKGKELGAKKDDYTRVGIAYYAVFDPLQQIQEAEQMNGELLRVYVLTAGKYVEMTEPFWLETVGLGLTLWQGTFEEQPGIWLRWCDKQGEVILTGAESSQSERLRAESERLRAESERLRAESERLRATRLAERLREMGVDPNTI
ncbi:Uma2 family endonuclease [Iningainema tapete]|uniref:Uma2 family endonuclease n=1 Tax=Iningainema tapete BLCC-T55 TaxID=2748662 RepID=A0A8J7C8I7_9CYAN|nr:Uma2 family endonuclease [Iningainema tapete]MBD2776849.1 Uma2 family endonuclease [Iningainema tapete BLCC-T55]